jgi:hypothetical protein
MSTLKRCSLLVAEEAGRRLTAAESLALALKFKFLYCFSVFHETDKVMVSHISLFFMQVHTFRTVFGIVLKSVFAVVAEEFPLQRFSRILPFLSLSLL